MRTLLEFRAAVLARTPLVEAVTIGALSAVLISACGAGSDVASRPNDEANLEIGRVQEAVLAVSTIHQCDLAGMGSKLGDGNPSTPSPKLVHNFPGVTQAWLNTANGANSGISTAYAATRAGVFSPPAGDTYLGTGTHANHAPIILGTDRGDPFERKGPNNARWIFFQFGDSIVPPKLGRQGDTGTIVNDDPLGFSLQTASPGGQDPNFPGQFYPRRCIDLLWTSQDVQHWFGSEHSLHRFDADPTEFDAATLDGYGRTDIPITQAGQGYSLGSLAVPGPGFGVRNLNTAWDKVYMRFPDTKTYSDPNRKTNSDLFIPCATQNTDTALQAGDATCQHAGRGSAR